MDIEKQVCSLGQSKRLKELGIAAQGIWMWVYPATDGIISSNYGVYYHLQAKDIIEDNDDDKFDSDACSAYSVAELGVMLPDLISTDKQYELVTIKEDNDCWLVRYVRANNLIDDLCAVANETEATARAAMIIYLLDKGLVTAEEINNRLKS